MNKYLCDPALPDKALTSDLQTHQH